MHRYVFSQLRLCRVLPSAGLFSSDWAPRQLPGANSAILDGAVHAKSAADVCCAWSDDGLLFRGQCCFLARYFRSNQHRLSRLVHYQRSSSQPMSVDSCEWLLRAPMYLLIARRMARQASAEIARRPPQHQLLVNHRQQGPQPFRDGAAVWLRP